VIKVRRDDLVKVTFTAEDIPHSFTIDEYRISRRAEPGKPISFEFHAKQVGKFPIYCNLTIDDRCLRELHGTLIVEPR
jgi:heme/copper-type cytochrome/quinol oxidase subunit 2